MDHDSPRDAGARVTPFSWPTRALVHSIALAAADGGLTDHQVMAAARLVAEDARRHELPVERALVALQREWAALTDMRLLEVVRARELLDVLVTACISAYDEAPSPPPPAPAATEAAVALLHVIETVAPAVADDERSLPSDLDPEAEERLAQALAAMSADDTAALLDGLRRLLRALRRERRPRLVGRAALGVRFRPRAP